MDADKVCCGLIAKKLTTKNIKYLIIVGGKHGGAQMSRGNWMQEGEIREVSKIINDEG